MRIVCISDTHLSLTDIAVPDGDVLIHAGDLTDEGTADELLGEYSVLSRLPHRRIIVTPGNHDDALENPQFRRSLEFKFPRITTLVNEGTILNGLPIYGSSWQQRGDEGAIQGQPQSDSSRYSQVPTDISILVTHGPPYGIQDGTSRGEHVGSRALRDRLHMLTDLRLHIFGHVHFAYGITRQDGRLFVNASTCDDVFDPINRPIVIDYVHGYFKIARI
ncbi:MAG: metallophosphatase domain-containing protein [bacterium]|nr:metallophosphatase domain-containing protein [bacterium]